MTRKREITPNTGNYLHLIKKDQVSKKKSSLVSKIPVYKALRQLLLRRVRNGQGMKELVNETE